jgi:cell division protein FtsB
MSMRFTRITKEQRVKIEELQSANEELKKKIELLKRDKLYREKVAREELRMIKEGEKIIIFEE